MAWLGQYEGEQSITLWHKVTCYTITVKFNILCFHRQNSLAILFNLSQNCHWSSRQALYNVSCHPALHGIGKYQIFEMCHTSGLSNTLCITLIGELQGANWIYEKEWRLHLWSMAVFLTIELISPLCRIYTSANWVSIGSGNGLSPHQRQAITWTNADFNWTPRNKLETNFNDIRIRILSFSCKKLHLKLSFGNMAAILSRGSWVKINCTYLYTQ